MISRRQEQWLQWLEDQAYRPSTRKQTLSNVTHARRAFDRTGRLPASSEAALRRYALFLESVPAREDSGFDATVRRHLKPTQEYAGPAPKRKLVAQRFEPGDWRRLIEAIEDDKKRPEATVLLTMARSGLRVADVLRLTRSKLTAGLRRGVLLLERKGGDELSVAIAGAPDVWKRLDRLWRGGPDDNVALWVCPNGDGNPEADGGAYKRVARYLKKLGKRFGFSGRVHTHRLRRTVAMQALSLTKDVHAVQHLLGHRALSSTLRYVDEFRRDDVAALQQQIREVP